ncbi:MAG: hypothetical protein HW403_985, partial [Dehalococcoidia bacterium]|nr:hypothetical protein [Dehalococcoidia bacterium]
STGYSNNAQRFKAEGLADPESSKFYTDESWQPERPEGT